MTDEEIKEQAITFSHRNKKRVAKEFTDINKYPSDIFPVSVFMAGSPGAGKTESSINLIASFSRNHTGILRIDTDEFRILLPNYSGKNSSLFQGATTIIAERIHDEALNNRQSFVFDGTLTNLKKARENIERSLKRKRHVQILYVYQDPKQAWDFVKAREMKDGRHIPKEVFIEEYFCARENANILKSEFGSRIKVDLIIKNIDGSDFDYRENIDKIDNYISEKYTKETLEGLLN
jgi:UDP-N-acetylglucosamine kinase